MSSVSCLGYMSLFYAGEDNSSCFANIYVFLYCENNKEMNNVMI